MKSEDLIKNILKEIGENPNRGGLIDTPKRVVKSWTEIYKGYDENNKPKVQIFKNGKDGIVYDEMIVDQGVFYSTCEHHMMTFFGKYYFAYTPNLKGNIIGLSKLARIVDYHSSKLQIQERLVNDIVEDVWQSLKKPSPVGMGLIMKGTHLCKCMRGIKMEGLMITSKMKGNFLDDIKARNEFLQIIKI